MDFALVDFELINNIGCFCDSAGWVIFNNYAPINLHLMDIYYMIFILE